MISDFLFNFTNVCVIVSFFLTKLLTLGFLFSTTVRAAVVVLFTSLILTLREALVANLVISGI